MLENDTILGDILKNDVGVSDIVYQASGSYIGLDTNTISAVDDLAVLEDNVLDSVLGTSSNRSNGKTVAS